MTGRALAGPGREALVTREIKIVVETVEVNVPIDDKRFRKP